MREEGPHIKEKWRKRPAMEISVTKPFQDQKGNDRFATYLLVSFISLTAIYRGCTILLWRAVL